MKMITICNTKRLVELTFSEAMSTVEFFLWNCVTVHGGKWMRTHRPGATFIYIIWINHVRINVTEWMRRTQACLNFFSPFCVDKASDFIVPFVLIFLQVLSQRQPWSQLKVKLINFQVNSLCFYWLVTVSELKRHNFVNESHLLIWGKLQLGLIWQTAREQSIYVTNFPYQNV